MGIEIDFLAVGEGAKSGDAIALRFGNLHGRREEQTIITIDGGTVESGENLVEHVKRHYGTDYVDLSFLTHLDRDHASGMRSVVEKLRVGTVVMHRPWLHSKDIHEMLNDGRCSVTSIKQNTRDELEAACEVEKLALAKNIKIVEPFTGVGNSDGSIRVLGPTPEYYTQLLTEYDFMPGAKRRTPSSLMAAITRAAKWIAETWDSELLVEPDPDAVSAENNSSMILLITVEGKHYLFTGDAGVPALMTALKYAATIPIDWSNLAFMQAPHHGSKRNLGPSLLNSLLGNPKIFGALPNRTVFISAAKEGQPKHPNKRVINALCRRGVNPFVTAGNGVCHFVGAPARPTWSAATPLPFYNQVEDDE